MENTFILIERAHKGDKGAREKVFHQNYGLVCSVAKRFTGRGADMEDLIQIGSIGLLKAVDYFDTAYNVRFSTYAVPMIAGEIKRYLRDDGMIKVSRSLKEKSYQINKKKEELERKMGRVPTIQELSEKVGMDAEELILVMESGYQVESLQKTFYQGDGNEILLQDKIQEKENGQEKILNRIFLEELLQNLEKTEKNILYMRYFREMTQIQIAKELDISQVQVSRIEKRILKQLREKA